LQFVIFLQSGLPMSGVLHNQSKFHRIAYEAGSTCDCVFERPVNSETSYSHRGLLILPHNSTHERQKWVSKHLPGPKRREKKFPTLQFGLEVNRAEFDQLNTILELGR
jgi:hypothetical protein